MEGQVRARTKLSLNALACNGQLNDPYVKSRQRLTGIAGEAAYKNSWSSIESGSGSSCPAHASWTSAGARRLEPGSRCRGPLRWVRRVRQTRCGGRGGGLWWVSESTCRRSSQSPGRNLQTNSISLEDDRTS